MLREYGGENGEESSHLTGKEYGEEVNSLNIKLKKKLGRNPTVSELAEAYRNK